MRLVAHYLRSDGPFGGAPLTWLDATPAELAIACAIDGLRDGGAQEAFLAQFDRASVSDCLTGRALPTGYGSRGPGFFRYLVLTCLVSATDEGAGDSRDFRARLGKLLGAQTPIQAVSGVNWLWTCLCAWVDQQRRAGEPLRRVELPHPGSMTLIGYAVRLAFPSLRDRTTLTISLRGLPDRVRRSPSRLVEELRRPHFRGRFSPPLASALDDFAARLKRGSGLLGGHRFWRLVESIGERIEAERAEAGLVRWRLEASFGGWEHDLMEARLLTGTSRSALIVPDWEGPFAELLRLPPERLPVALMRSLRQAVLILSEAPGALWVANELPPTTDSAVVVLAALESVARTWPLHTRWHDIGGGWARSDRLAAAAVVDLAQRLGVPVTDPERVSDLKFEGGVPTRRGSWLGRPGYLPDVCTSEKSEILVQPLPPNEQSLKVGAGKTLRALETERAVTGRWSVLATDGGVEAERLLILEADFPERREWASDVPAWAPEVEMVTVGERTVHSSRSVSAVLADPLHPYDDLLEALYAHVGNGRGESEVVELMKRRLPKGWLVWDVLRALSEAGWMEPRVYESWRARRWRLCPPSFVVCSEGTTVAEGALGTIARCRLREAAAHLGGHVFEHRGCEWAPPVVGVTDVDPVALAKEMEWPWIVSSRPSLPVAPECWPKETRSLDARQLRGVWDFDLGMFKPPIGPLSELRLERLVQDTDRDLYRVTGAPGPFVTTSRTVAILEAHRRARVPLFRWRNGELQRTGRSGHLPLPIARTIRRLSLMPSGPREAEAGTWTYTYTADAACAAWAAQALGAAVEVPAERAKRSSLSGVVACRRAGLAPSWWAPPLRQRPDRLP